MTGLAPPSPGTWHCALRGFGTARATAQTLPGLRKQPGPVSGPPLPANLLNHAEDQTVVGVSAVLDALAASQLPATGFRDWGVVGAPRFPGRIFFDNSLEKFGRMGPLSVSPLIVPFLSLHALSSMVSLALRIHGPAVGAGGGRDGIGQALLTGLALQQENELPGVWVVLTGWDPEPFSRSAGDDASPPVCHAAALALLPAAAGEYAGPELRLVSGADQDSAVPAAASVSELVRFLVGSSPDDPAPTWRCAVPGGYGLEMTVGKADRVPLAKSA